MKKFFKSGVVLLALIVLITNSIEALSDIKHHWAKSYIEKLVESGSVGGYPDGTYRPNNNIKIGEFLKIVIINFGGENDVIQATDQHWATPYYQKAMALKYLTPDDKDFGNLNNFITRAQIARVLGRIAQEKQLNVGSDIYSEANSVTDFDQLKEIDRIGVLYMLRMGVIEGYNDGSFQGAKLATRAELATMIYRFKNPKITSANPAFQSILIKEGDGINTSYFTVVLRYDRDIEPQIKALETYLENKLSADEAKDVMNYVKGKTNFDEALAPRIFSWKRGSIRVQAPLGSGTLTIIAD